MTKNSFGKVLLAMFAVASLYSCSTMKQVEMFQDADNGAEIAMAEAREIVIGPSDRLSIVVNSKDPELAAIFNLPIISHQVGLNNASYNSGMNQISSYTVSADGYIDFPVLGAIHVGGLGRRAIADKIKNLIISENLIKDPTVTVEFAGLFVSVCGEVSHPGRVQIDKDLFTLVDALSKAGDLSIVGQRTNVKVFRAINGKQVCYEVDMTKANDLFNSPVYYLQQDDIIYVVPNEMKARQSTVNGNNLLSLSFWVSVGSLLTSVASLILSSVRYYAK